jgi:hypothetical protein
VTRADDVVRGAIDETVVDAFVETPSRLEMRLARKEPVVVRMLGESRLVHGPYDALAVRSPAEDPRSVLNSRSAAPPRVHNARR